MALLMLLDGNSLTYRAFFALPTDLATASGQVTNAVYGFTSMLVNLLKDHHPDRLAVAFDRPEPTFRHELVAGYNATRSAAPDILRQQMGLVRQLVETMRIPIVDMAGFEADDVLATLATQAAAAGDDVIVVTGDRDTYQLVEDPHLKVLYNRRGVSDYALYDEAGIFDRTGVTPRQYPQFAALRGDPSDNLPGVPGVGEKTAARLITTYGDLDNIYAHVDELTPRLRESLVAGEDAVRSNAKAIPLVRDLPISLEPGEAEVGGWDVAELRRLFEFLEFRTLWERLAEATGAGKADMAPAGSPPGKRLAVSLDQLGTSKDVLQRLHGWAHAQASLAVSAAWEGREGRSAVTGLAFAEVPPAGEPGTGPSADQGEETVLAWWLGRELLGTPEVAQALEGLLGARGGTGIGARRQSADERAGRGRDRLLQPRAGHLYRRLSGGPGRRPVPARGTGRALRRHRAGRGWYHACRTA